MHHARIIEEANGQYLEISNYILFIAVGHCERKALIFLLPLWDIVIFGHCDMQHNNVSFLYVSKIIIE